MSFTGMIQSASPFGPIFGKELRVTSRRKRSYLLRVGYLGVLLLLLVMVYATTADQFGATGVAARNQQMSALGFYFFACFTIFSVWSMGLIGPVLTCTAVGSERLHKTLGVLLMTPISAWQIVSGKLFSRLLAAFTLIGLSLPVLALVRLLGGVELQQMVAVICIAAAAAMGAAAIGLFFSTLINKAYGVLLLSYGAIAILYVFAPMIAVMFTLGPRGPGMGVFDVLGALNPYFCALFIVNGGAMARSGMTQTPWVQCVAVQTALTLILMTASALLIRRATRREAGRANVGTATSRPAAEPAVEDNDRSKLRRAKAPRGVSDHPILWHEFRRTLMPGRRQAIAGGVVCVVVLCATYFALYKNDDLHSWQSQMGFAFIFNFFGWLLTAVLAGTAIAQEKESDTWTLLLATPVSGRAIVWGKAIGVLRRMLWPAILLVAHFAVFTIGGVIKPAALLLVVWVIVSFNTIWVATGVYLSLRFKKVTAAVIINIMLAIVVCGLFPLLLVTVIGLARMSGGDYLRQMPEFVLWYEPYYYVITAVDVFHHSSSGSFSAPGFRGFNLTGNDLLVVAGIVGCLHIGAAVLILEHISRRFDSIVGRARQVVPWKQEQGRSAGVHISEKQYNAG